MEMDNNQHNGEHSSNHTHSYDPHIWLSLSNVSTMATNIYNGLAAVDPENKDYYRQNLDSYLAELDELDHTFRQGFSELENRVFIIQHPSLGYFARDYNLTQVATEEGGSDATIQSMVRTIKQAKENNIKIIFVSPQFPPNVADAVAREINGVVEPLDSLAPDYTENMEHIYNIMLNAMNDGQAK
jgi:zinc transport system substrate-binding protein